MLPWIHLDTARVPGGDGDLRLLRRGDEFAIMLGQNPLMNSRLRGSEEALATRACEKLQGRGRRRILIGGLGMGFTLRAALRALTPDDHIAVAELSSAVVAWARGPMAELFGDSLSDPRVAIHVGDVGQIIRDARDAYDAILLDVDNGPEGLTRRSNDALYDRRGLNAAHRALRDGGVLAVWSTGPDAKFTERLRHARFDVEEARVRAHAGRSGARHVIWFATRNNNNGA